MKNLLRLVISCLVVSHARAAEPELKLELGNGISMDLVLVKAGEFSQGSTDSESGRAADETQRPVTISRDYYLGRTAVTRSEWEGFVQETGYRSEAELGSSGGYGWSGSGLVQKKQYTWRNPGFSQTGDHPVCLVTFPDAQEFCKWLERKTNRKVGLPTEAQWEYACRAGTTTPWSNGNSADDAAWHKGNSGNATHPVDSKAANAWGFHIGGNVSEWCLDWYAPYQAGPVSDPCQENPNLSDKPRRVLRGGSWNRAPNNTRSAARFRSDPRSRNADIGFRVVCAAEVIAAPPPNPEPRAPQVELEPGMVPPSPAPVSRHEMPQPSGRGVVSGIVSLLLGSLLFLAIPIGIVVVFVRLIAGHGRKQSGNPFVVRPPAGGSVIRARIRKVDDGFWVLGEWPAGTVLCVRYVVAGATSFMDLLYQPGPGGHFVFTGRMPDSASVLPAGVDPTPPPLFVEPPPLHRDRETPRPNGPRPPIFPSAY